LPHLTVECSANLQDGTSLAALCRSLHDALTSTALYELGAIRIRVLPCPHYLVGDGLAQNAFAAMVLRIGAGRILADRQRTGEALIAAARIHFAEELSQPYFALSLDIVENDPALSWKVNTLHARLRRS
jgi:5-carboxymethyl-2-hydroxymuconate isomerase